MRALYKYKPAGDRGILVEVGNEIAESVHKRVMGLMDCIEAGNVEGIEEVIPAYCTLLILYNPLVISYATLVEKLRRMEENSLQVKMPPAEVVHIPVLYGGETGMDLPFVAEHNGLTEEEVIKIHSGKSYLVYMLGFTPGFPYLGGLSKSIFTPRLETPRKNICVGSVGIGGEQTGIYPVNSPGGWRIIGRTPIKLFDMKSDPIVLLRSGQYVKFEPVCPEEYDEIDSKVQEGRYEIVKSYFEEEDTNERLENN